MAEYESDGGHCGDDGDGHGDRVDVCGDDDGADDDDHVAGNDRDVGRQL